MHGTRLMQHCCHDCHDTTAWVSRTWRPSHMHHFGALSLVSIPVWCSCGRACCLLLLQEPTTAVFPDSEASLRLSALRAVWCAPQLGLATPASRATHESWMLCKAACLMFSAGQPHSQSLVKSCSAAVVEHLALHADGASLSLHAPLQHLVLTPPYPHSACLLLPAFLCSCVRHYCCPASPHVVCHQNWNL